MSVRMYVLKVMDKNGNAVGSEYGEGGVVRWKTFGCIENLDAPETPSLPSLKEAKSVHKF